MEHTQPTIQPVQADEFVKVFLVLLLVDGVLGLVQAGISWAYQGMPPSSPFAWIVNLVSFAVFILAIVLWIRAAKRKYPKYILWTSIVRVLLPIVLGILAFAATILFIASSVDTAALSSDPTMVPEEIANKLKWFSLFSALTGVAYLGLGVNALVKLRQEK